MARSAAPWCKPSFPVSAIGSRSSAASVFANFRRWQAHLPLDGRVSLHKFGDGNRSPRSESAVAEEDRSGPCGGQDNPRRNPAHGM